MNGNCFEIGTIQAFLDGETTPDVSIRLTSHVAGCDACARSMATAEEENSVVFSTLERELNTLVPTQRLWNRINETITVEKSQVSIWQKIFAFVRTNLANPSLAAAAGIIIVIGMFALLWTPNDPTFVAREIPEPSLDGRAVNNATPGDATQVSSTGTPAVEPFKADRSNLSPDKIRRMVTTADLKVPPQAPSVQYASDSYLPGEEGYVRTIADLKQNVDAQKDTVLTPSSRVSYERDMAVVQDSINRMREVVKKNPRNQAARQVLYSSYQDKIDLLNSVAQREELMASMR